MSLLSRRDIRRCSLGATTEMDRKHKGAHAELLASAWLLDRGYDVFRNVSPYGFIDLIGWKDGKFFPFDVKSNSSGGGRSGRLTVDQYRAGVFRLYVDPTGDCFIDWSGADRLKKRIADVTEHYDSLRSAEETLGDILREGLIEQQREAAPSRKGKVR
jgi:hypothetical protein